MMDYDLAFSEIENLEIVEPVGFKQMMDLVTRSKLVITDSGGLQKEAFFNKTPCLTLRDETEWMELVEAGWNLICPPNNFQNVVRHAQKHLGKKGREVFHMDVVTLLTKS